MSHRRSIGGLPRGLSDINGMAYTAPARTAYGPRYNPKAESQPVCDLCRGLTDDPWSSCALTPGHSGRHLTDKERLASVRTREQEAADDLADRYESAFGGDR